MNDTKKSHATVSLNRYWVLGAHLCPWNGNALCDSRLDSGHPRRLLTEPNQTDLWRKVICMENTGSIKCSFVIHINKSSFRAGSWLAGNATSKQGQTGDGWLLNWGSRLRQFCSPALGPPHTHPPHLPSISNALPPLNISPPLINNLQTPLQ